MITKYLSLREHLENYKIHWPRRRFLLEAMTDPDPFALLALRFFLVATALVSVSFSP